MPTYLCIQRSQPREPAPEEAPSPAQMEEMYAHFTNWMEKFKDNLGPMGRLSGGAKVVTREGATDGPFVEAKEVVGGYMLVTADSLEEAVAIARESPGVLSPGSSVEVREIAEE